MPIQAPTPHAIARAAEILRSGGLVVFPTETVYGLAANAFDAQAVDAVYRVKNRPRANPLIHHIASLADAADLADFSSRAQELAHRFWPGPLTLILPLRYPTKVAAAACAGQATIALRWPAHPVAQAVISACTRPLVGPSANRSGQLSPTSAAQAERLLAAPHLLVLDGGRCQGGLESTVLDMTTPQPTLRRPGLISAEELTSSGITLAPALAAAAASPGQSGAHYAPARPLRLNATTVDRDEALLAFGAEPLTGTRLVYNLSPKGCLAQAAQHLYAALDHLGHTQAKQIAAMPIPHHGLGHALNDRLTRAAQAYKNPAPTP